MPKYILNFHLGTTDREICTAFLDVIRKMVEDCKLEEIDYELGVASREEVK